SGGARLAQVRAPALVALVASIGAARLVGAAEPQPAPPALDAALDQARSEGRALVVEFGTTWCAPCKILEQEVLPDADVQNALEGVVFVRYDAERAPGVAAARKFEVTGFPTIIAVNGAGQAVDRIVGVRTPALLAA